VYLNESNRVWIRPHHGLCMHFFVGQGYSDTFVDNMKRVIERLNGNPDTIVDLRVGCDVVCDFCPHNRQGICESEPKVEEIDRRCLSCCGLKEGQTLTWMEYTKLIASCILASNKLKLVCRDCEWLPLCTQALQNGR